MPTSPLLLLLAALATPTPVSYTHLDVYKRQDIDKLEDLLEASSPEYLEEILKARESSEFLTHEEVFGDI